jgi:hypothetical protein
VRNSGVPDGQPLFIPRHAAPCSFAFICYDLVYIDRANIGSAAAQLQRHLGLSSTHPVLAPGLFFSELSVLTH